MSTLLEWLRQSCVYPLTTPLVEIRLNREPMPLVGETRVFKFVP